MEENGCTCFENNNNSTGIDSDGDGFGSCVDPCPDVYGWIDGCLGENEKINSENDTGEVGNRGSGVSTMLCGFFFVSILIAVPVVALRLLPSRENEDDALDVPDPFVRDENRGEE